MSFDMIFFGVVSFKIDTGLPESAIAKIFSTFVSFTDYMTV